ncbi:hypothetical protein ACGFYT_29925 [Streptomyces sp. NPDC048208]|uniref:hypothetical protein n=1 Tax=Streptomyces sp. NPDC048208 TaxID=3365515 RepID=UPI003721BE82
MMREWRKYDERGALTGCVTVRTRFVTDAALSVTMTSIVEGEETTKTKARFERAEDYFDMIRTLESEFRDDGWRRTS